ncbi:glycerophosphodiester phosphodiesterase [Patescibacteria group bacterium]|nr:glycerophosphodiester phosphodiesterase [Patescibacteria group bacterium]
MKAMLKIGHRGASGYEPENTLRSFKKAIDLGVDMIELDVHRTRDGRIVVIHDETVDRTTNGSGDIAHMTLAEVKELDAGKGEMVPTLDEVLDLAIGKVIVDIEIKDEGLAESVAEAVKKRLEGGAKPEDFVISSFSENELETVAAHANLRRILLTRRAPQHAVAAALDLGVWGIGAPSESTHGESVDDVHRNGLKVFVWTAHESDEAEAIRRCRDIGVDGIFSNFPDRL